MDNPDVKQFVKACVVTYAKIMNIPIDLGRDLDLHTEEHDRISGYFHSSIERYFLIYVEHHKQILEDIFEDEKLRIESKEEFMFKLAASVVGWKLRNGYSHANFLGFMVWTVYLAFRFYDDGKRDFPKAAIFVIAETLEYSIEKHWSGPLKLGFEEMVLSAEGYINTYYEYMRSVLQRYVQ